ncbi:MAG: type II toxin-antitoxin system VapC family toxin [Acidimicrobiales bacterium]
MQVVADSHAIVWYVQGSKRLSDHARTTLAGAEAERNLVVSVASLIDLWYVTQTTQAVTPAQLAGLRERLVSSEAVTLQPITVAIADATTGIPRTLLADPWDRLIVATSLALGIPLVTRDRSIQASGLVSAIW